MRKILLILGLVLVFASGVKADVTVVGSEYEYSGSSYKCRPIIDKYKDEYGTQITGYDFINGITYCQVISKKPNMVIPLRENADSKNINKNMFFVSEMKSTEQTKQNVSQDSSIDYDISNGTTLSTFFAKLAVLELENVDEVAKLVFKENSSGQSSEYSSLELLNQSNIKYFKNLFNGMNSVYIHLQNLLFVVVGGFFLATLGGGKIQKYLENRGQSTGNKEPYLHKFFIPLLCAGVFYMPITSGGGVNSTMIQKIIQYFTVEANNIADKASALGAKSYMQRIYDNANIKYTKVGNIEAMKNKQKELLWLLQKANNEWTSKCIVRWDENYVRTNKDELNYQVLEAKAAGNKAQTKLLEGVKETYLTAENMDWGKKTGTDFDITLEACVELLDLVQNTQNEAATLKKTLKENEQKKAKNDSKKELENLLKTIDKFTAENEKLYGWINSIFMSSSGMLVEASSKIQKDLVNQRVENTEKADDSKKKRLKSKDKTEIDSKLVNTVMSSVAYLLLPGAETMRKIITGNDQSSIIKLGVQGATCAILATNSNQNILTNNIVGMITDGVICTGLIWSNATSSIPIIGTLKDALSTVLTLGFTDKISDTASFILGIRGVEVIYSSLLRYLPTIIVTIAGILAFLSYFLTLCKYYYISPFVVAFALTTKRVDKIINFLITGVTIFFKPVLIVLFIYLALFFHTVIDDIFLLF